MFEQYMIYIMKGIKIAKQTIHKIKDAIGIMLLTLGFINEYKPRAMNTVKSKKQHKKKKEMKEDEIDMIMREYDWVGIGKQPLDDNDSQMDVKDRYFIKRNNVDDYTVTIGNNFDFVEQMKVWEIPENFKTILVFDTQAHGLVSVINIANQSIKVTVAHIVSMMPTLSDEFKMINPTVYANFIPTTLPAKFIVVKEKVNCSIYSMRLKDKMPVVIQTNIVSVIRLKITTNKKDNFFPALITFMIENSEDYILSGSSVIAGKVWYVISSYTLLKDDKSTSLIVAHAVVRHDVAISVIFTSL